MSHRDTMALLLYLFGFLHPLKLVFLFLHLVVIANSCHDNERLALVQFKNNFTISKSASAYEGSHPKTLSWGPEGEEKNCCSWDGIKCKEETGHVIGLNLSSSCLYGSINSSSSLFQLVHLEELNLADNHFNYSPIRTLIGQFSNLRYLNLADSVFSGQIPHAISNLSKLSSLDLTSSYGESQEKLLELKVPNLESLVQNLTGLEELILNSVNIPSIVPDFLANFSSLTVLDLNDCGLHGQFPEKIFQLQNLHILDLGFNKNLTGFLPEFHQRSPLTTAILKSTSFSGNIPSSIENLKSLAILNMRNCNFVGPIPSSIGKLNQLTFLSLGRNNFSGYIPSSLQNLTQLTTLYLQVNQLIGPIPSWLGNLTQLRRLCLNRNKLHGSVPQSLSKLVNLELLMIAENNLVGVIKFEMFSNMKSLNVMQLYGNKYSLAFEGSNMSETLPKFRILDLSTCNISEFPDFLRHQDTLEFLDLSKNEIHGQIPKWMWNMSIKTLRSLSMSDNFLTGFDQPPSILPWIHLQSLNLDSNMLHGPLPIPPASIRHYVVSNNVLSGKIISLSICNLSSLRILDASNNNLSGRIPNCLGKISRFHSILNLRNNSLHGNIHLSCMHASNLRMIDFSHNQFQGTLPRSLGSCMMLESLNLGNNHLIDVFPTWLGNLPQLKLLILRKNGFYGVIRKPENTLLFPKLRIIDLSDNNFTGELPSGNIFVWNAMKSIDYSDSTYVEAYEDIDLTWLQYPTFTDYFTLIKGEKKILSLHWDIPLIVYPYSITIVIKGVERQYSKVQNVFVAIDLSRNKFTGKIPEFIGILKGLQSLNLSGNMLTGSIPSSLGNLLQLESLDLSHNKLSGEIPQQLVQLTFHQSFDVSHNNLRGHIPQGKQLLTFDSSSFEDNPQLCGYPLPKKCRNSNDSPLPASANDQDDDTGSPLKLDWKFSLAGCISGLVVGMVLGEILITRGRAVW